MTSMDARRGDAVSAFTPCALPHLDREPQMMVAKGPGEEFIANRILELAHLFRGHEYDATVIEGDPHMTALLAAYNPFVRFESSDTIPRAGKGPYDSLALIYPGSTSGDPSTCRAGLVRVNGDEAYDKKLRNEEITIDDSNGQPVPIGRPLLVFGGGKMMRAINALDYLDAANGLYDQKGIEIRAPMRPVTNETPWGRLQNAPAPGIRPN